MDPYARCIDVVFRRPNRDNIATVPSGYDGPLGDLKGEKNRVNVAIIYDDANVCRIWWFFLEIAAFLHANAYMIPCIHNPPHIKMRVLLGKLYPRNPTTLHHGLYLVLSLGMLVTLN